MTGAGTITSAARSPASKRGPNSLLADQAVEFSLTLADRVCVLQKGQIRWSGPAARLREGEALRHELLAL